MQNKCNVKERSAGLLLILLKSFSRLWICMFRGSRKRFCVWQHLQARGQIIYFVFYSFYRRFSFLHILHSNPSQSCAPLQPFWKVLPHGDWHRWPCPLEALPCPNSPAHTSAHTGTMALTSSLEHGKRPKAFLKTSSGQGVNRIIVLLMELKEENTLWNVCN